MKVNDIKALDYQCQGDSLTIPFAETSVEAVLALDAAVLTVKTDAGDTVEVLAGYALKTVSYTHLDVYKRQATPERTVRPSRTYKNTAHDGRCLVVFYDPTGFIQGDTPVCLLYTSRCV